MKEKESGRKTRDGGEKEGRKRRLSSVNWSECTTKFGFTTKVSRSDCQYCQRNGVFGRGGSGRRRIHGGEEEVVVVLMMMKGGRQEGLL